MEAGCPHPALHVIRSVSHVSSPDTATHTEKVAQRRFLLLGPVFDREIRNSGEVSGVECHESQPVR